MSYAGLIKYEHEAGVLNHRSHHLDVEELSRPEDVESALADIAANPLYQPAITPDHPMYWKAFGDRVRLIKKTNKEQHDQ